MSMQMHATPWISIIVTSHNYGRFLGEAIDSSLQQTYTRTEVIVVDDGSTDNSRDVIAQYGDRIIPVLKENAGQASAFNAGFRVARGNAICFLDSDDTLLPTAIERAVERWHSLTAKVHWPLNIIDHEGKLTGEAMHRNDLAQGDVLDALVTRGPGGYNWSSTSGNLWCSNFLTSIYPIPEDAYAIGPDVYLSALVPFFGLIERTDEVQGCYRLHGNNNTYRQPFEDRIRTAVAIWDHSFSVLAEYCRRNDLSSNLATWREHSWWHQTELAVRELAAVVPDGESAILVDENHWMTNGRIGNRPCLPFLEREGEYWGPPQNCTVATRELERMRENGAGFLVFTSATAPWLEYYPDFRRYLDSQYKRVLENSRLIVFDLN